LSGTYIVLHQRKEPRVGLIIILLALLTLTGVYFWFRPGRGGREQSIPVSFLFESAERLTVGDPVLIAGVRVGTVTDVALEGVGRVRVDLEVAERVRPLQDARAQIRPLDFIGDVFVSYRPGETGAPVAPGARLPGMPPTEGAFDASGLMKSLLDMVGGSGVLANEEIRVQLRETLAAVDRALKVMGTIETGPMVEEAVTGLTAARSAAARLDSTLSHPAVASASARLEDIRRNAGDLGTGLTQSQAALDRILQGIKRGEGTLGRLQTDTALRRHIEAIRSSLRRPS